MKVCIVAEGCYPYVVGGVSGWINSLIKSFPNVEFILLAIVANRSFRGKFVYELPENLTQVYEVYLEDSEWEGGDRKRKRRKKVHISRKEYDELLNMVLNRKTDWGVIFDLFHKKRLSVDDLLMGEDFFLIARECYNRNYSNINFSDFLWTLRSIYLPMFWTLKMDVPKADLYHCVATGYSGILEYIPAGIALAWAYEKADTVTCLYDHARELQIELGCPEEKIKVTPNGINTEALADLPGKSEEEQQFINAGAVLRVTPIKDVKTMIQAFDFAKKKVKNLKLWIMGPADEDVKYAQECYDLVESLGTKDIEFTGRVNVKDYLGKMDFTLLTSISEGQPLTILESYAAHKPVIATDVGNCRELIYGSNDDFGEAGILTHIMNIEEIAHAMVTMSLQEEERLRMGEAGYKRVNAFYRIEQMKDVYREVYQDIYKGFSDKQGLEWTEEPFSIGK